MAVMTLRCWCEIGHRGRSSRPYGRSILRFLVDDRDKMHRSAREPLLCCFLSHSSATNRCARCLSLRPASYSVCFFCRVFDFAPSFRRSSASLTLPRMCPMSVFAWTCRHFLFTSDRIGVLCRSSVAVDEGFRRCVWGTCGRSASAGARASAAASAIATALARAGAEVRLRHSARELSVISV
jgi:hypothetical protein